MIAPVPVHCFSNTFTYLADALSVHILFQTELHPKLKYAFFSLLSIHVKSLGRIIFKLVSL